MNKWTGTRQCVAGGVLALIFANASAAPAGMNASLTEDGQHFFPETKSSDNFTQEQPKQISIETKTDWESHLGLTFDPPKNGGRIRFYSITECNGHNDYIKNCDEDGSYAALQGHDGYLTYSLITPYKNLSAFEARDSDPKELTIGLSDQEYYKFDLGLFEIQHPLVRWFDEDHGAGSHAPISADDALRMETLRGQIGARASFNLPLNERWSVYGYGAISRSKYSFFGDEPVFASPDDITKMIESHGVSAGYYLNTAKEIKNGTLEDLEHLDVNTSSLTKNRDYVISLAWLLNRENFFVDQIGDLNYKPAAELANKAYSAYVTEKAQLQEQAATYSAADIEHIQNLAHEELLQAQKQGTLSGNEHAYQSLINTAIKVVDSAQFCRDLETARAALAAGKAPEISKPMNARAMRAAAISAMQGYSSQLDQYVKDRPQRFYRELKPMLEKDAREYLQRYQTDSKKWSSYAELGLAYDGDDFHMRLGNYYQTLRSGFDSSYRDVGSNEIRSGAYGIMSFDITERLSCSQAFSIDYFRNHYGLNDKDSGNGTSYTRCDFRAFDQTNIYTGYGLSAEPLDGVRRTIELGLKQCFEIGKNGRVCAEAGVEKFSLDDIVAKDEFTKLEKQEGLNHRFALDVNFSF